MPDSQDKIRSMIRANNRLKTMDPAELEKIKDFLHRNNIDTSDKKCLPKLMSQKYVTLESRYNVLKECGFLKIDAATLLNFVRIISIRIDILKAYGYFTDDICVTKLLMNILSIPEDDVDLNVTILNDYNDIRSVRSKLLNIYLRRTIETTSEQLNRMFTIYKSIQNKSLQSIVEIIKICKNELNLSNERICNNAFILSGDPNNLNQLIYEMKTLGGVGMRELLHRRPKLGMSSFEKLQKTEKIMCEFGITTEAMSRCTEVFTLNPETIYQRLLSIKKIDEFNVLFSNPGVLRLVHYQNKARIRLEYLKLMKFKCVSLHCLSTTSEVFEK